MSNNIEQIKSKVSDAKNQIEESKQLSVEDKMAKAKELEVTISQIKIDLDSLKVDASAEDLAKIQAVESEYESLNTQFQTEFKQALSDLETEVKDGTNSDDEKKKPNEDEKGWIKTQRDKIPEGGKAALKVAGGIVGGVLIWRGIKKLFGRGKEKKEGEEKGFWNTGLGKVVKRGSIGIATFLGIRRLLDYFKKGEPTDDDKEQYESYLEFMEENPEDYKQYEQLGGEVNNMYDKARDTEINNFGFESSTDMGSIGDNLEKREGYEHVETKGMVAYCLDNYYTNVDEMLSAGGYRSYVRENTFAGYEQDIKKWSGDQINKFLVPYLSVFTSWTTLGIVSSDSAQDKMTKFFDATESTEERKQQLDMFFRQYGKMMTYMADKNNALKLKYAEPILKAYGYNGDTWPSDPEEQQEMLLEATNDKEWIEKNLSGTPYQSFRDSKILGASKVLESEGLLNSDITFELQEIIDDLDQDAEDILGGFDNNAILDAKADLLNGKSVEQSTKQGLSHICDNLMNDIGDEQNPGWFHEHFDYLAIALDLDSAQQEELLKESGMGDCVTGLKTDINKLKADVLTNPTKENVEKLEKLTGEYLALKKEFELMMYAISQAKENKGSRDYVVQIFNGLTAFIGHTFGSMFKILRGEGSAGDIPYFFLGLTISGTALVFTGRAIKGIPGKVLTISGRVLQGALTLPLYLTKLGMRMSGNSWAIKNKIISLAEDGNTRRATNLLKKSIANGKISPNDAILSARKIDGLNSAVNGKSGDNFINLCKKVVGDQDGELFAKFYQRNRKFTGKFTKIEKIPISKWDHRISNIDGIFAKDNISALRTLDSYLDKIPNGSKASEYFNKSLSKIENADDILLFENLSKNNDFVKKIDGLTNPEFRKLKKISLNEIRKLQSSGDFDLFIKGNKNLDDILSILGKNKSIVRNTLGLSTNIDAATKTKFNSIIDEAIASAKSQSSLNRNFSQINADKLSKLKKNKNLTELDMESLVTLHGKGFRGSSLPDLFNVLKSDIPHNRGTGKLGDYLQDALKSGDYDSFVKALGDHKNLITKIDVDDIIRQMDSVKVALRNVDEFADILKGISRIIKLI